MNRNILILTKDEECGRFCKAILGGDYSLRYASDWSQLGGNLKEWAIDLVIMHSRNGNNCLETLKNLKRTINSPIFVLSENDDKNLIIDTWQEGAAGFLFHPPDSETFYAWVSRTIGNVKTSKSPLERAREFIELNFDRSITLNEIAQQVGFSAGHLCRAFKERFGVPPMRYLQEVKIRRSQKLLIDTDLDLKHIISQVGYTHTPYFCREFKKHTGISPIEYRQKMKNL